MLGKTNHFQKRKWNMTWEMEARTKPKKNRGSTQYKHNMDLRRKFRGNLQDSMKKN